MQDAAEAAGQTPQEFVDEIAPLYQQAWRRLDISNDDFIRTTEERHKVGVAELLQRCYDAGDIELDVYKGKYCVACEEYYTDDELDPRRPVPDPQARRSSTTRRRTTSSASAASRTACSTGTPRTPAPSCPSSAATRRSASSAAGCATSRVSRTSLKWGIPLPWDAEHVAYVWFDALANYITAVGFGTDDGAVRPRGGRRRHLIGKDIIRHHCVYWPAMLLSRRPRAADAAGPSAAGCCVGGEKMSKTSGNVVNPLDLDRRVRRRRVPLLRARRDAVRPGRRLHLRGPRSPATTATSPTTSATCSSRVATVVGKKCDGIGPAPSRRLATRRRPPPPRTRRTAPAWAEVQPSRALEPTWSLIRATNAHLEANEPWKAEPGPAVDAVMGDALEALRIVAVLASPALPDHLPDDLGAHRPARPRSTDQRLPGGGRVGRLPRRAAGREGRAAVPADDVS